jgi:hypothetical protein
MSRLQRFDQWLFLRIEPMFCAVEQFPVHDWDKVDQERSVRRLRLLVQRVEQDGGLGDREAQRLHLVTDSVEVTPEAIADALAILRREEPRDILRRDLVLELEERVRAMRSRQV